MADVIIAGVPLASMGAWLALTHFVNGARR